MSTKTTTAQLKRFHNASSFFDHLKLALEFHHDPQLLAQHSPLAQPYFLYQDSASRDDEQNAERVNWGEVLVQKLYAAQQVLWGEEPPTTQAALMQAAEPDALQESSARYDFLVLELNYFKQIYRPIPKSQAVIYNDILHIGRTTHDRHLRQAVERLGEVLLRQLRPGIQLESPMLPAVVVGREALTQQVFSLLKELNSVSLVGRGGYGKTTVGQLVAELWPSPALFWYTFRPNFNDRLSSLLFALGYFLHQQGASGLWLQIVADGGEIKDQSLLLGLALADLSTLQYQPLLIFDEVDLLRTQSSERENIHHIEIIHFVESLRTHVPLLLIGQRNTIATENTLAISAFGEQEILALLDASLIPHSQGDIGRLMAYTAGSPRLLALCLALYHVLGRDGRLTMADVLAHLPQTPALTPIWDRIQRRLSADERKLMQMLSVFRTPAPYDLWQLGELAKEQKLPGEADAHRIRSIIQRLVENGLLHQNHAGSLFLLPALREHIYSDSTIEEREDFHLVAAAVMEVRGDFTEAAYHLWKGERAAQAVQIWSTHKQTELQRGQSGAALSIFEQISTHRLEKKSQQRQLALLRGELYRLNGQPDKVLQNLSMVDWPRDEVSSIDALLLWGKAFYDQGDRNQSQNKLVQGINAIDQLQQKRTMLHIYKGWSFLHDRDIQNAWREARSAQYQAESLQGALSDQTGQYEKATKHYDTALKLAKSLGDDTEIARTHNFIAITATHQKDFSTALIHYQKGIDLYKNSGNRSQEAQLRSNLAACHLFAGNYHEAIAEAEETLKFYEKMNSSYWIALNATNLAEAHLGLGNHAEAEQYAMQVMAQEEVDCLPYALHTMGLVRKAEGKLDEAKQLCEQSTEMAVENEDRFQEAMVRRSLGELHAETGNQKSAVDELNQALALFEQLKIEDEINTTRDIITEVESQTGL